MTDLMGQDDTLARRAVQGDAGHRSNSATTSSGSPCPTQRAGLLRAVAALRHAYDATASRRAARLATTRNNSGQIGHYQWSLV